MVRKPLVALALTLTVSIALVGVSGAAPDTQRQRVAIDSKLPPLSMITLVFAILALTAGSASANGPSTGCVTDGFFLAPVLDIYPITGAVDYPITDAVDSAGNQYDWVYVKFLNTPETAAVGLLVIDNRE